jgi:hypothetical protein
MLRLQNAYLACRHSYSALGVSLPVFLFTVRDLGLALGAHRRRCSGDLR